MATLFDVNSNVAVSLSAFNRRITDALDAHSELCRQWVVAETSDVAVRRGHCYLELIEKDPASGATVAKAQAVVWANAFTAINARFKAGTGADLVSGLKVMVCVTARFHAAYGLKLEISDINPEYTLGDIERRRREILDRLTREGVIGMNRALPWPAVPQRIAVISAPTAAGYGDFVNQLAHNPYGLRFYTCLFAALMQGAGTVPSVLAALDRVNSHIDLFDCVVVIRGGGATSDLLAFDNYELAAAIAQFPIPVIVGIGHERDITVLDYVAAGRVKTPTAAAEWLVHRGAAALVALDNLQAGILATVRDTLSRSREQLSRFTALIPAVARRIVDAHRLRLEGLATTMPLATGGRLEAERTRLAHCGERMAEAVRQALQREHTRLATLADKAELLSPINTLKRGYALAERDGHFVTDASTLTPGDTITVHLATGRARTTVQSTE